MELSELFAETSQDMKIEDTELDRESLRTPYLYDKYLKMYITSGLELKKHQKEYDVLKLKKFEYYTGKADPEVYKENPKGIKVLKGDLDLYLDADPDLRKIEESLGYIQSKVTFLEKTLKNIENRNWNIKNTIEWRKFLSGVT
tara:strand:- start:943 stop:1371 length:429 start_codon:yes stop_codon:yes gene_type:complete